MQFIAGYDSGGEVVTEYSSVWFMFVDSGLETETRYFSY